MLIFVLLIKHLNVKKELRRAHCLKIAQKVSIYSWQFFSWKFIWDIFERFSIFFFSHLIFLLLFWYNIVIAVIFICIVEMMCDKCDNFFFLRFFHTLKYNLVFLIFFSRFFFWVTRWNTSGNSRILTLIDYLPLSVVLHIFCQTFSKNLRNFWFEGRKKEKQKLQFLKRGGEIFFFIEWDFLCWRYNQIFSFILLDHLKNRKNKN